MNRPMLTSDLNEDPVLCDCYHEATHAVVGVVLGLWLVEVTGKDRVEMPPHARWDHSEIEQLVQVDGERNEKRIEEYCDNHGIMCVAPVFGESRGCDTTSLEQQEAFHGDYLDAECFRTKCRLPYFGLTGMNRIKTRAKELVEQYGKAIDEVAKELRSGETLSHDDVAAIIKASQ